MWIFYQVSSHYILSNWTYMFCLWLSHASGHLLQHEDMDPAQNTYTYMYP